MVSIVVVYMGSSLTMVADDDPCGPKIYWSVSPTTSTIRFIDSNAICNQFPTGNKGYASECRQMQCWFEQCWLDIRHLLKEANHTSRKQLPVRGTRTLLIRQITSFHWGSELCGCERDTVFSNLQVFRLENQKLSARASRWHYLFNKISILFMVTKST